MSDELPIRSGYGFFKRSWLAWSSALRYAWQNRTLRGFGNQLVGEMFRLQTDYFPELIAPDFDHDSVQLGADESAGDDPA